MNGKMIKGLEAGDGWGTRGEEAEACKDLEEGGLTGAGGIEVRLQVGSPRAWLATGGALADSHHCPCSTPIVPPRSPCSHCLSPHTAHTPWGKSAFQVDWSFESLVVIRAPGRPGGLH